MSNAEKRADGLRQAVEIMISKLDKSLLRPMQKESYLCMSRCCDSAATPAELQNCCTTCEHKVHASQQLISATMSDFQHRLQRCVQRCQDMAQETLSVSPSEKEMAKANDKLANCAADCAQEYEKQVPKLQRDIGDRLKQLR